MYGIFSEKFCGRCYPFECQNEDNEFVHSFGQFEFYYEKYDAEFR